ncbi:MAG: NAD(P)-dependent alcohol dehydrogenase [Planctomycetota bacterium]
MKAFRITTPDKDIAAALQLVELDTPAPGPGQVQVRVRAASLNFRDLIVAKGGYPRNDAYPTVPLSDAAGEVSGVGEGVTQWEVGDRVSPNFLPGWTSGAVSEDNLGGALGGGIDGVLAERIVVPASGLVSIPGHLSFEQAATLPCAALTAWNALTCSPSSPGQTVLLLGTGGVSVFGLQLAQLFGLRTIVTSSSDEKLAQAKSLGADHTINYATHPEWQDEVKKLTDGRGADRVLEVGGDGTLERSLASTAVGGTIALIGLLSGGEPPSILPVLLNAQRIQGIYVGSAALFADMNRAIEHARLEPVIDKIFDFADAPAAYNHLKSQKHLGKVVIRI